MTSCPWMNEHGLTCEGARQFLDDHVMPCAKAASDRIEDAVDDLRAEVRAKPIKALVIAGLAGFALGLGIAAAKR